MFREDQLGVSLLTIEQLETKVCLAKDGQFNTGTADCCMFRDVGVTGLFAFIEIIILFIRSSCMSSLSFRLQYIECTVQVTYFLHNCK